MASRRDREEPAKMSLHERFTYLRQPEVRDRLVGDRVSEQLASAKNRRLAMQLERRQNLIAAIKKIPRVATGASAIRERLSLPRGFVARRRGSTTGVNYTNMTWKSPLLRRQQQKLGSDSPSVFSNSPVVAARRSRSPFPRQSRNRRSVSRNRSLSRARNIVIRGRSRSKSPFPRRFRGQFGRRGGRRGGGTIRRQSSFINTSSEFDTSSPSVFRRGGRSRGRGWGRGRGRGRGRRSSFSVNDDSRNSSLSSSFRRGGRRPNFNRKKEPLPTKEELDKEIEQYMSSSKSNFDKEKETFLQEEQWD